MKKFWVNESGVLYNGDALDIGEVLENQSIDMCITSPPYWALRNYSGNTDELGQEPKFWIYIDNLVTIFDKIYPIIKDNGSLWVVIGDTFYSSSKGTGGKTKKQITNSGSFFKPIKFTEKELPEKSLCNIPARFSIAMQEHGWLLRNTIIWHKPNGFVTSAKDRFTVDYEYVYWFVKQPFYYFNQQFEPFSDNTSWKPVREKDGDADYDKGTGQPTHRARNMRPNEKGRNMRSIWSINTQPVYGLKHHAKYPEKLLETPINATCPQDGIILDPFMGSGTTALVAEKFGRKWVGIEISEEYCETIKKRLESI